EGPDQAARRVLRPRRSGRARTGRGAGSVRVALLCGGLGGARLAPHLARRHDLTVVCNVADDLEVMGLHVSPDVDTVLYALAGLFDEDRGYGIRDDTGEFMARAGASGAETWFWIGDQDLATHVLRSA